MFGASENGNLFGLFEMKGFFIREIDKPKFVLNGIKKKTRGQDFNDPPGGTRYIFISFDLFFFRYLSSSTNRGKWKPESKNISNIMCDTITWISRHFFNSLFTFLLYQKMFSKVNSRNVISIFISCFEKAKSKYYQLKIVEF